MNSQRKNNGVFEMAFGMDTRLWYDRGKVYAWEVQLLEPIWRAYFEVLNQ